MIILMSDTNQSTPVPSASSETHSLHGSGIPTIYEEVMGGYPGQAPAQRSTAYTPLLYSMPGNKAEQHHGFGEFQHRRAHGNHALGESGQHRGSAFDSIGQFNAKKLPGHAWNGVRIGDSDRRLLNTGTDPDWVLPRHLGQGGSGFQAIPNRRIKSGYFSKIYDYGQIHLLHPG